MSVPPDPVLRAAVRWLERLPLSGTARCRALFTTHSDFSDITPTQYESAYTWLTNAGLLSDLNCAVSASHRVFNCAITQAAGWFSDADVLVREPDEIPEDALRAAELLGLQVDEAFAHVRAAWGKVNTAERERVGTAGEVALVELLSAGVKARVEHVAAISDGYGYDISVRGRDLSVHIEVKSTVRRGRLTVYLSRNEFETMCRDSTWLLVAVRLTPALEPAAIVTVPRGWVAEHVPARRGIYGRWETCRLEVPPEISIPGIPDLLPVMTSNASGILLGATGWE
ncbi:DUF3883 domain-containing protein [Streptomyces sp. NPDC006691]|uniref:DUF3883 domain-containing protein n=1 Tax=Streptomyces sp. NPDC006691 TaxID=3364757 RepID=UPI0036C1ADD8